MIIGLKGNKGSGKSTVALHITKKYSFIEKALADPIKQIGLLIGFSQQQMYGSQKDKETVDPIMGISGREFLQKMGTEIGREIIPQIIPNFKLAQNGQLWINTTGRIIDAELEQKNNILISDIRFPNEAEMIKSRNGIIIEIQRDTIKDNYSEHSSESSLATIKADYVIENNGSFDYLYTQINNIIDSELIINS